MRKLTAILTLCIILFRGAEPLMIALICNGSCTFSSCSEFSISDSANSGTSVQETTITCLSDTGDCLNKCLNGRRIDNELCKVYRKQLLNFFNAENQKGQTTNTTNPEQIQFCLCPEDKSPENFTNLGKQKHAWVYHVVNTKLYSDTYSPPPEA